MEELKRSPAPPPPPPPPSASRSFRGRRRTGRPGLALLVGMALALAGSQVSEAAVGYYPRFSPFFFLCTHHGELEGDGEQGEVLMALHIAGNPTFYVPGQEYHGKPLQHGTFCRQGVCVSQCRLECCGVYDMAYNIHGLQKALHCKGSPLRQGASNIVDGAIGDIVKGL
ncbi:hypothetical protein JRQ81_015742 [Phrynocephalus forsythii]|uniref:Uncharacterized protein n=1 Tax=Phrynocephalus forsythii TaxID=171643 RepID=A0A9Q1B2C3_9SAUR|nr:hypothetical protein JRQ81_015742 [Phrynocephalus forsythii]